MTMLKTITQNVASKYTFTAQNLPTPRHTVSIPEGAAVQYIDTRIDFIEQIVRLTVQWQSLQNASKYMVLSEWNHRNMRT